jgi:DNA-binding PadR family transcriptional regulator
MPDSRISLAAGLVLHALNSGFRYGFDVMDVTGLPSGTVYPALRRLEQARFIRSAWEPVTVARAEQRPPRKYYVLTPTGATALGAAAQRYRLPELTPRS